MQAYPLCVIRSLSLSLSQLVLSASLCTLVVDICHFGATQHLYLLPSNTAVSYGGLFLNVPWLLFLFRYDEVN